VISRLGRDISKAPQARNDSVTKKAPPVTWRGFFFCSTPTKLDNDRGFRRLAKRWRL
jgi:hypothetical protein